jgi:phosphoribosylanthranilate isomerase
MRVKICGITQLSQAQVIAKLGATALGFICLPQSPRYISAQQIEAIISQLSLPVDKIGVFVHASPLDIEKIVKETGLTGVQLHGDESPEFCQQIKTLLPEVEVIKALRLKNLESLQKAENYFQAVDTLLLDAYHPQQFGGTGKTLNWEQLRQFSPPIPWLLAGGLTPDNIVAALAQVSPDGIDLSSGLELSAGDKDLAKVAQLFTNLAKSTANLNQELKSPPRREGLTII